MERALFPCVIVESHLPKVTGSSAVCAEDLDADFDFSRVELRARNGAVGCCTLPNGVSGPVLGDIT